MFDGVVLFGLAINVVQVNIKLELDSDLVLGAVLVFGVDGERFIVVTVRIHVEARHPELTDLFFDCLLS